MSKNSGVDPEFLPEALDYVTSPKGFGQRKDMERLVLEALARYQGLRSNSLLWSDVREELKDIERAAADLLKRLRRASAFSISRLGTSTRLRPFFRKAYDANGRPVQSRGSWDDAYEHGASGSKFLRLLEVVSHTAATEARELYVPTGGPGGFPEPSHPIRELIRDCYRIFEAAGRTGSITKRRSSEKRDFHEFVRLVYEMATGKSGEPTRIIREVLRETAVQEAEAKTNATSE